MLLKIERDSAIRAIGIRVFRIPVTPQHRCARVGSFGVYAARNLATRENLSAPFFGGKIFGLKDPPGEVFHSDPAAADAKMILEGVFQLSPRHHLSFAKEEALAAALTDGI